MEFKAYVKPKKNQTKACMACKKRKRRCSGVIPCDYCVQKGKECIALQPTKRGPKPGSEKKHQNEDNNNSKCMIEKKGISPPLCYSTTITMDTPSCASM